MNPKPIEQAKDHDIRNAQVALQRAAVRARELAQQTHTFLVVNKQGQIVKIK